MDQGAALIRLYPRKAVFSGNYRLVHNHVEISELAEAMGVHRNMLSRIAHDKGVLTTPMAIKLAAALGNTPEFWLNIQHAVELWDVRHKAYDQAAKNVKRVKPLAPLQQA